MFEMDNGAKRWMLKTARENFWRVRSFMEWEDLIQDGYWQWARVVDRYGGQEGMTMPHMMSLFKRTFIGHLHTIALRQSRRPNLVLESEIQQDEDDFSIWETLLGEEIALAGFFEALQSAPPEVRKLLEVLTSDEGCARWRRPYRRRVGHRETTNERLCKLIGADPEKINLVEALRNFLTGRLDGCVPEH